MRFSLKIIALIYIGVLAISCGDMSKTSEEIITVIEENCDCMVYADISSYGINFSSDEPTSTGERYKFILTDFNTDSLDIQVNRIKEAINAKEIMCKDKFITLNFRKKDSTITQVFIDNCSFLE